MGVTGHTKTARPRRGTYLHALVSESQHQVAPRARATIPTASIANLQDACFHGQLIRLNRTIEVVNRLLSIPEVIERVCINGFGHEHQRDDEMIW